LPELSLQELIRLIKEKSTEKDALCKLVNGLRLSLADRASLVKGLELSEENLTTVLKRLDLSNEDLTWLVVRLELPPEQLNKYEAELSLSGVKAQLAAFTEEQQRTVSQAGKDEPAKVEGSSEEYITKLQAKYAEVWKKLHKFGVADPSDKGQADKIHAHDDLTIQDYQTLYKYVTNDKSPTADDIRTHFQNAYQSYYKVSQKYEQIKREADLLLDLDDPDSVGSRKIEDESDWATCKQHQLLDEEPDWDPSIPMSEAPISTPDVPITADPFSFLPADSSNEPIGSVNVRWLAGRYGANYRRMVPLTSKDYITSMHRLGPVKHARLALAGRQDVSKSNKKKALDIIDRAT
jgi:hypothetical protein